MTDQERLSKQVEQSNPCRDDSDRELLARDFVNWNRRMKTAIITDQHFGVRKSIHFDYLEIL